MKALKTIFSALLALVVLVSTTSFTIERHVCMDRVYSIAILQSAATCGMELMAPEGVNPMKGCCQDQQTTIEGNDLQVKMAKPVALEFESLWVATIAQVIETFDSESAITFPSYLSYKPPLIDREIPVLFQSFLI